MATKLNDKQGARRLPGGKRMTFEGGQPKSTGSKLPLKTSNVNSRKGK